MKQFVIKAYDGEGKLDKRMDVTELHDEENLLLQTQDRWENYGSLDGIADTHDPFDLAGAPRFELSEKINSLLNHALTADENLLLRQTLGMGCKQRSVKDLAQQMGTTQKAVQEKLVDIVEKLRHHDDSIQLWKYLNR
jgi:DNA-directed RNA polymerase sigma subunit (sigma70/sigma32)